MIVSTPQPDPLLGDALRALHEEYVDAVNRAAAEGRDDLVVDLVARYPGEALGLMVGPLPRAA
jgi:hypothetical protein